MTFGPFWVKERSAIQKKTIRQKVLPLLWHASLLEMNLGRRRKQKLYQVYKIAPVAYQVILEPGTDQFREFDSPRVHTRTNSWGLFLVHKSTCGKRESVS